MNHYGPHLVPLSLDTSVAGNKLPVPEGIIGLRLDGMPPGVMLGLFERGAQEPARVLLPGSSYHFESEECIPDRIEVMTPVSGTAYLTGWRRGVVLLGGSVSPRRPGSAVVLYPDDPGPFAGGAGDTSGDLVLGQCPPDRSWQVLAASGFLKTSAVAGSRSPTLKVLNGRRNLSWVLSSGGINPNIGVPLVLYANTVGIDGFQLFGALEVPPNGVIAFGVGATDGSSPPQAGDQLSRGYLYVRENVEG